MLRTLQNRLILSHLLPLFIVIPLMGITFIYVLETRVILPGLADDLVSEGELISEFTRNQPELWQNSEELKDLMLRLKSQSSARLMFLDPDGRLLVSSDPSDAPRIGSIIEDEDIPTVQSGEITHHIEFSKGLQQEVIDVFTPVFGAENNLIGIVRLSHPYTTIYDDLLQLRLIIAIVLIIALIAGISLGLFLAVTINSPIKQVTSAIDKLASGNKLEKINLQGPEEIQSLVDSTNTLYERLYHLENARKQLLANLVHEIGRPLGAIRSAIQALKLGAGKDPQLLDELTAGMDDETARLQHLLNELAHMHDQIFGTLELNRQEISTKVWLTNMLRPWKEAAQSKGLNWIQEFPEKLPDLQADSLRLAQAIENLVSNAIKYSPKGETVTITVSSDEENLKITVSDTGIGIDPEEHEKIFMPFYRGDQGKRIKQGMGLGLSITRDVVHAHRGEIHLESRSGAGSKFIITIPLK